MVAHGAGDSASFEYLFDSTVAEISSEIDDGLPGHHRAPDAELDHAVAWADGGETRHRVHDYRPEPPRAPPAREPATDDPDPPPF